MTRRLLASYLAIAVVVLVALQIPLALVFEQREEARLSVDSERDATVLASFYEDALERGDPLEPTYATDYATRTATRVVVVGLDGISLLDTASVAPRDFSTRPEIQAALAGDRAAGTRFSTTLDTELLYVAVPIASGGEVHGALRITLDTHEIAERVMRFRIGLGAIAAVVLVLVAGVGWVIARSVTQPLRALRSAAGRFAGGDLRPIDDPVIGPPEIVDLRRSLDTMAAQLDGLLSRQRAFVADASHQLRTPLTALRLRLENVIDARHESNAAPDDDLEAAVEEVARLQALVTDLLRLARAERTASVAATGLAGLVRDRVDTWGAVAGDSGVEVVATLAEDLPEAFTVPGSVEQILDNLIDNALRVAPADSTITVAVERRGATVELSVADTGPGLPSDQRARATERFWRGSASGEGSGLGLAIVDALVTAAGGSVRIEANSPTGLVVTCAFAAVSSQKGQSQKGQTQKDQTQKDQTQKGPTQPGQ